ncbi:hypothetical protein LZ575_16995 [Antarcticibacterium sp. 1MA-6-2]|uniref:hypothetical protein n=1 Tax=Antarcticibacterium sp. 1MA-6-2 TaxID=2908210 RepID=UPI001F17EF84|nr:hypothetical protein [Antarcticibacterium sp. 1MA-6-2]UJH90496.1 hypothetical protein LZ575_16995 [Antarcticibacterium sp. 1MA-6-2]
MKKIFWCISIIILTACNQNAGDEQIQSQETIDTTALQQPLQVPNEEVILLPEAREITSDWLAYLTAQSEINNFSDYTLNEVISNATPIAEIMQSLRQTVPAGFRTNAVQTRLSVLYTKAKVLERLSRSRNSKPEEIAKTAEELPVEFNNLKIQLNELFLKTLEDFEQELDELEEIHTTPDTIPVDNREEIGSGFN